MSTYITDAAAFVLPSGVSVVAAAAAFAASVMRRPAAIAAHATDLTGPWSGSDTAGTAKRTTTGTSYDPQSRGSTG